MFFIFKIDSNMTKYQKCQNKGTKLKKRLQIERSVAEISRIRIRKASVSANSCDVNPTIA